MFGSSTFWDNFFENYSKLIYFNIRKTFNHYNYTFSKEDIEDCYGDVTIKILSQKSNIEENYNEEKSKFTTYLSVIISNRTIDFLNKNKYKYNNVEEKEYLLITEDEETEISIDIERFLKSEVITDREKLILKMFYLKDLPSKDIAKILNITDNTVRVSKKKAIDKLKKEFKDEMS